MKIFVFLLIIAPINSNQKDYINGIISILERNSSTSINGKLVLNFTTKFINNFDIKTLVMTGENDLGCSPHINQKIAKALKNSIDAHTRGNISNDAPLLFNPRQPIKVIIIIEINISRPGIS